MPATRSRFRISIAGALLLTLLTPWIVGQGCIGPVPIPVNPIMGTDTGNQPPMFVFTSPGVDIIATVGEIVRISWIDEDPDSTAVITLLLDPDDELNNGNEILASPLLLEDTDSDPATGQDHVDVDTGELGLEETDYRVIARVNDGVNPEMIVIAPGRIDMRARFLPSNVGPHLVLTSPEQELGLGQGDTFTIEWCARDPDDDAVDPTNRSFVPDVIILIDLDDNPDNDIDLTGEDAESTIIDLCYSDEGFPRAVPGAILLGCAKDDDCANDDAPTAAMNVTIDIDEIPPRPAGQAYRIRGTMWDHINRPVHSYARGSFRITGFGIGVIDLAEVGQTIKGAVFMGHDAGGMTGFNGLGVGDMTGDGVDDFLIISRFGRPYGYSFASGTAHLVFGLPEGQEFAGEIPLNSITTEYPGTLFTMPPVYHGRYGYWFGFGAGWGFWDFDYYYSFDYEYGETEGIVNVTKVGDVNGDGLPEFMLGMPYIETWPEWADDDPQDKNDVCYNDGLPNPMSDDGNCDWMGPYDWDEGVIGDIPEGSTYEDLPFCYGASDDEACLCTNDGDLWYETPLGGGYTILVSSADVTNWNLIHLESVGADSRGWPEGARFRGAWYPFVSTWDYSTSENPLWLQMDNRWGETIATMPRMYDTAYGTPDDFGSSLLVSAPHSDNGRGSVTFMPGQDFTSMQSGDCAVQSFPFYEPIGDTGRVIVYPDPRTTLGEEVGDYLGYAGPAGDYNRDGSRDIAMGAPGADRDGLVDNGIVYVMYGRPDYINTSVSSVLASPRMEIHGTNDRDQFGLSQMVIGDINHDGLPDVAFSTPYYDGPGGVDSGFIGILFGGRTMGVGTEYYTVDELGGPSLPGVHIYGSVAGGHAGVKIANAGDFNADGNVDLLVLAPEETRFVNGQTRLGVAYLLFGGPHLNDGPFHLSQIGTDALPGVVFVGPFEQGSADEATIDFANPAGDINGDGFADILLGTSEADWVNPLDPTKRRNDAGRAYLFYGSNIGSNTTQ